MMFPEHMLHVYQNWGILRFSRLCSIYLAMSNRVAKIVCAAWARPWYSFIANDKIKISHYTCIVLCWPISLTRTSWLVQKRVINGNDGRDDEARLNITSKSHFGIPNKMVKQKHKYSFQISMRTGNMNAYFYLKTINETKIEERYVIIYKAAILRPRSRTRVRYIPDMCQIFGHSSTWPNMFWIFLYLYPKFSMYLRRIRDVS